MNMTATIPTVMHTRTLMDQHKMQNTIDMQIMNQKS